MDALLSVACFAVVPVVQTGIDDPPDHPRIRNARASMAWRRVAPDSRQENGIANKNTICLWYDGSALDAARFYAATFPNSAVGAVMRAPGDYPSGKEGDVLTVEFSVAGIPCVGLNGGPEFKHNEAFSFQSAPGSGLRPRSRGSQACIRSDDDDDEDRHCRDRGGAAGLTPFCASHFVASPRKS